MRLYNFLPLVLVPVVLEGQTAEQRASVTKGLVVMLALGSIYAFFQYRYGVFIGAELSGVREERWLELVPGTEDRYIAGGFFFHRLKFSQRF